MISGTASDPVVVGAIARAEAENRDFAMLWRALVRPNDGPDVGAEALRRTARAAVEDWLEARDGGR